MVESWAWEGKSKHVQTGTCVFTCSQTCVVLLNWEFSGQYSGVDLYGGIQNLPGHQARQAELRQGRPQKNRLSNIDPYWEGRH